MKTLLTATLALVALALASCSIPIPDRLGGGTVQTTPGYHDFDSPDNRRTNPNAKPVTITHRVPPATPLFDKAAAVDLRYSRTVTREELTVAQRRSEE